MGFGSDGSWDERTESLMVHSRWKLGGLYQVLHGFALDMGTRRHSPIVVLNLSLEYGCSEVCNTN